MYLYFLYLYLYFHTFLCLDLILHHSKRSCIFAKNLHCISRIISSLANPTQTNPKRFSNKYRFPSNKIHNHSINNQTKVIWINEALYHWFYKWPNKKKNSSFNAFYTFTYSQPIILRAKMSKLNVKKCFVCWTFEILNYCLYIKSL